MHLKQQSSIKGYMGAINSPTRGKANPINGISLKVLISFTSNPTVLGGTKPPKHCHNNTKTKYPNPVNFSS
jgi:hypothetical protein